MTAVKLVRMWEDDDEIVLPGIHKGQPVTTLDQPLPLCWIAEGKTRGATDEEWAVSADHGALPGFYVTELDELVDCRDCREWMHA